MPQITVEPGQLSGGAGMGQSAAALITQAAAQIAAAAQSAAGAAGEAGASGAISGWGQSTSSGLQGLSASVTTASNNLGAAAQGYERTEQCAIPTGGGAGG